MYNSLIEDVFEDRRKTLVLKYKLEDYAWLQGLYNLKHKWIKAYTQNIFSVGQNTMSWSEGMNAIVDSYVSSCTGLNKFVEIAQKTLERQFMRENKRITKHVIKVVPLKCTLL